MRKTESNILKTVCAEAAQTDGNPVLCSQSDIVSNLNSLAQASGRLCEVVVSACKNRTQFKESAEKGKRAKTDIKAVKEMCAVLKELTAIVKTIGGETETEGVQGEAVEVIFGNGGEKFAL